MTTIGTKSDIIFNIKGKLIKGHIGNTFFAHIIRTLRKKNMADLTTASSRIHAVIGQRQGRFLVINEQNHRVMGPQESIAVIYKALKGAVQNPPCNKQVLRIHHSKDTPINPYAIKLLQFVATTKSLQVLQHSKPNESPRQTSIRHQLLTRYLGAIQAGMSVSAFTLKLIDYMGCQITMENETSETAGPTSTVEPTNVAAAPNSQSTKSLEVGVKPTNQQEHTVALTTGPETTLPTSSIANTISTATAPNSTQSLEATSVIQPVTEAAAATGFGTNSTNTQEITLPASVKLVPTSPVVDLQENRSILTGNSNKILAPA